MVVTGQKAYQILGIEPGTGKSEIKKRYRQLMLQVHPDAGASLQESYEYSAQEISVWRRGNISGGRMRIFRCFCAACINAVRSCWTKLKCKPKN